MRIAVVDDDAGMREKAAAYLERFSKETGTKTAYRLYADPQEFLSDGQGTFDLLLLDVEMPGMDGITLARKIRKKDESVMIMFLTNMAQYALHGYEVDAVDYVVKPIGYPDFAMKMKKVLRYLGRRQDRQILLQTTKGLQKVSVAELVYVEVIRHYLHYHTKNAV